MPWKNPTLPVLLLHGGPWEDLNLRPSASQADTLIHLSYTDISKPPEGFEPSPPGHKPSMLPLPPRRHWFLSSNNKKSPGDSRLRGFVVLLSSSLASGDTPSSARTVDARCIGCVCPGLSLHNPHLTYVYFTTSLPEVKQQLRFLHIVPESPPTRSSCASGSSVNGHTIEAPRGDPSDNLRDACACGQLYVDYVLQQVLDTHKS